MSNLAIRRPAADRALEIDAPGRHVLADVICAQRLLPRDPDLAAFYIDGALRALIALAAVDLAPFDDNDNPLQALDQRDPVLARRFRLALRAPNVAARLDHLNALIALLSASAAFADSHES